VKPPPFEYAVPRSLDEALALLAERGDDAKVLAGGQSLVPLLNFRLTRPSLVVDLNGVEELDYLDGGRIGALARTSRVEREAEVPLLRHAASFVGHPQIRNRGTACGSVAHADPAAELPCALLALGAAVRLRSAARGERDLPIGEFVRGAYWTALEPDELLVEVAVPEQPAGTRAAFAEHSRVHGDFALAGAAVLVRPDALVVSLLGVDERAVRLDLPAEAALDPREAAALAVRDLPRGHRRALAGALVRRALAEAA
jgi:CO/xanthine dehydrogenase FAD-binding subunit